MYWTTTCLDLQSVLANSTRFHRETVIAYVKSCQKPSGGFAPHPDHDEHMTHTLCAIQILSTLSALTEIDRDAVVRYVVGLQQEDGCFVGDRWLEVDTRFSMCGLAALALLGALDRCNREKALEFIQRCRNYDGGFGTSPGAESHSAMIYCCLGSLAILNRLDIVDADQLGLWLARRQLPSGGLNGKMNFFSCPFQIAQSINQSMLIMDLNYTTINQAINQSLYWRCVDFSRWYFLRPAWETSRRLLLLVGAGFAGDHRTTSLDRRGTVTVIYPRLPGHWTRRHRGPAGQFGRSLSYIVRSCRSGTTFHALPWTTERRRLNTTTAETGESGVLSGTGSGWSTGNSRANFCRPTVNDTANILHHSEKVGFWSFIHPFVNGLAVLLGFILTGYEIGMRFISVSHFFVKYFSFKNSPFVFLSTCECMWTLFLSNFFISLKKTRGVDLDVLLVLFRRHFSIVFVDLHTNHVHTSNTGAGLPLRGHPKMTSARG